MRASRFVAKNTALMTFGLFAGRILAFFIFRKLTGAVETDGMGIYGVAIDLSTIALTVANFGLTVLITREVVKNRENTWPVLWGALRIRWLLSLIIFGLLTVYVYATGFEALTRAVVLVMAIGVIIEATNLACDSVLQAHEKVEHQTTSQLVSAVVYFALGWWWLDAGYGLMGIAWANVISRLARTLVLVPQMYRHCGPWRRSAAGEEISLMWMARLGFPMFLAMTFGVISFKIDTVMLMEMIGRTGAGIYTIGHRLMDLFLMIPYIFAAALFPSLQRYREQTEDVVNADVERMGERALRYLNLLIIPLTLFCILAAKPIIELLAKSSDLGPSISVFRIVMLGLPLQAQSHVYNRLLMSAGQERVFLRITLAVMFTNILLNLLLIPVWEWNGAAMTTIVSLGVGYVLHRRYTAKTGLRVATSRGLLGTLAAAGLAWGATVLVIRLARPDWGIDWRAMPADGLLPLIAATLLTGVLFVGLLFALRIVDRSDLGMLRGLLPGARDDG